MDAEHGCCGPSARKAPADLHLAAALAVEPAAEAVREGIRRELVAIPGGFFEMGARRSTFPGDLDSPRRKVRVAPFLIAPTTVTNEQFARFVQASGYLTVAEREGWSYVFHLLLRAPRDWPQSPPGLPWWRRVDGAFWGAPEGSGSDWQDRPDHPAVHISWYDALAYCAWAGLRLPREAEWERAARGGHARRKFPWGDTLTINGRHMMNTWQGIFPSTNTAEDGHLGTAPVRSFEPNDYGLWNMTGNVWEWVADAFGPLPAAGRPLEPVSFGPTHGVPRVQRGGSFLCHASYCDRYHVHSRNRNDPDGTTSNTGFRVACDAG
ncbi:SUMF1/EgtB/PvdO family nonheme iron enzyme [bacterium]|nr:SUMF1/EgtB/PvdO family nonheme iron enzyme [bacterium]